LAVEEIQADEIRAFAGGKAKPTVSSTKERTS
jgi:hypothetical protein